MEKQHRFIDVCVDEFKPFTVNRKIGIKKWDGSLIVPPICIETPDLNELENFGYTFIHTEEGGILINKLGQQLLRPMEEIGWFYDPKYLIVAFKNFESESCGLYFVENKETVNGIDDATMEPKFIQTVVKSKVGAVSYEGKVIFEPNYKEIAIFGKRFFIAYDENAHATITYSNWKHSISGLTYYKVLLRKRCNEVLLVRNYNGKFQWIDCETGEELEETRELANFRKLAEKDLARANKSL